MSSLISKVFGTSEFLRLWLAQFVTSVGEWVFFLVVAVKAAEVGQVAPEGAVALVLLSRLAPGLFFGQLAGVIADRWNRQRLLAICDIGRAITVCIYPFASEVWHLIALSLILEAFTLLWIPAKEAMVPNLVDAGHLPQANTLSVVATYGTFPLALVLMLFLDDNSNETTVGFLLDAVSFVISAALILSIAVRNSDTKAENGPQGEVKIKGAVIAEMWEEFKQGWKLVFQDPTLRAVNIGLSTALIGGGMMVPLGPAYATKVLSLGNRGYYIMLTCLGVGLLTGVGLLLPKAKTLEHRRLFGLTLLLAGAALFVATSLTATAAVFTMFAFVGAFVAVVYILGFTILQSQTDNNMRGRVFAAFYSLARVAMLSAVVAAPGAAVIFDRLIAAHSNGKIDLGVYSAQLSGVRITFWLAAAIITASGAFAMLTIKPTSGH